MTAAEWIDYALSSPDGWLVLVTPEQWLDLEQVFGAHRQHIFSATLCGRRVAVLPDVSTRVEVPA